jgi:hypothetical protein
MATGERTALFFIGLLFALMLALSVQAADTCVTGVQNLPVSCTDGTIMQDTYNGCRTVVCANGDASMQILACDKPDGNAQYFEMYKQSQTGTARHICLGSTCISETNFVQSSPYPYCSAPTSPPNTTNSTSQVCYSDVKSVPANCTGTITSDTYNGCRNLACSNAGGSITVQACDKQVNSPTPQYFEMYRQASTGVPPKLCLDGTCLQNDGYAKSSSYPICVSNTSTCTPTTEVCNQQDDNCNGQVDENNVCGPICTPTTEICNGVDDNCNGQVDENNVCGAPPACFTTVRNMPVNCTGTITQDSYDGCRHLLCATGGNSIQVLACDKPTPSNAEYFEMYKQAQAGTPPRLCIGNNCIQNEGFIQSGHYPICLQNVSNNTCTPATETCNQQDDNCNGQIDENNVCAPVSTCYTSVKDIPATCTGASITSDTWNGCRTIICGDTKIMACNKPDGTPTYFEMYKQAGGSAIKICIGSTCISDNGYAKSSNFPICTNGTTTGTSGFVWIEPVENQQNTPPNFFHLNVEVPSNEALIPSTEWEIYNQAGTERVWYASNTGSLRFHTHTPDGTFQGSLAGQTQLLSSTTYKVRTRWHYTNGTITDWSSWRTFTTSAPQTGGANVWTAAPGFQVERVATGFDLPVHIIFAPAGMYSALPDNQEPLYYVTELYGKVKVVHKDGSVGIYAQNLLNFDPFGSITGGGQMGLIGLYVDDQTGDLFLGMTYVENDTVKNKVMRFTSTDDGNTFTTSRTLISGLPSAPSHQVEDITKGPDGKLYIQLGDGLKEKNAQNDSVLAGKIIRMNLDGTGVETYAKGFRNPFGGDWRPGTNQLFVTDNSPNTNDRLLRVAQGGNYQWGTGTNAYVGMAIDLLNVSPVDVEFNRGGNGFPNETTGRMYVAVGGPIFTKGPTNGKEVWEYQLDTNGNIIGKRHFLRYTGTGYGTPIGLDFGADGLYFTDIYGEAGFVGQGKTEGNIYRITPGNGGCINCGANGTFRAGISVIPWYPKDNGNGIEYIFECQGIEGSGSYFYDFDLGNGQKLNNYPQTRIGPVTYPYGDHTYNVSCTVHDKTTSKTATARMTINPADFIPENGS